MARILTVFTEPAFALLRIVTGFLFFCHGAQKAFGWFPDPQHPMTDLPLQIRIGSWIELVTGLLMAVGLFTRSAAFLASGTMAVAYVQFHWRGRFDINFFPTSNGGEPAVINAFVFLFIACKGAGILSVDRARAGRERT